MRTRIWLQNVFFSVVFASLETMFGLPLACRPVVELMRNEFVSLDGLCASFNCLTVDGRVVEIDLPETVALVVWLLKHGSWLVCSL